VNLYESPCWRPSEVHVSDFFGKSMQGTWCSQCLNVPIGGLVESMFWTLMKVHVGDLVESIFRTFLEIHDGDLVGSPCSGTFWKINVGPLV